MSYQLLSPVSPTDDACKHRKPRTLVLCFDGTSNEFHGDKDTNVVLLFQCLERHKPDEQLVYYQTGIGTYAPPGFLSHVGEKVARWLDEALAWYLEDHILGGYRFLMSTYRKGDRICLFGFSRGAYTARALTGMLRRVGLLHQRNVEQVPFAYKIFKMAREGVENRKKDPTNPQGWIADNFLNTFSRKVEVDFLGIWDTVESVGFVSRSLPSTGRNKIVKHFRHALALDERRVKFQARYWRFGHKSVTPTDPEDQNCPQIEDRIKEVWFAGGHGDVGGGWESSHKESQLSRIPFRWMIREARECTSAIIWDEKALQEFGVKRPESTDTKGLAKYRKKERKDALSEFHSAFKDSTQWWFWLILEFAPLIKWIQIWGLMLPAPRWPHFFGARQIQVSHHGVRTKVHSSVKTRLKHLAGYKNAAKWDPATTDFVDEWALPSDVE